jgi:tRNA(Ile)-lysidine synthetase-like protein
MALAFAAVTRSITIGHVVHDLRAEQESFGDRDAVRRLAELLAVPYVESRISTRDLRIDDTPAPPSLVRRTGDRNAESLARRLRYLALTALAGRHRLRFVATAHHSGDQLESILMALARGAGPQGLRGIAATRPAPGEPGVHIIRPMLQIPHLECVRLCRDAGWEWREDATNADTSRLRANIRHNVLPALRAARPDIERKAAAAAHLLADAAALVRDRAAHLLALASISPAPVRALRWDRRTLRAERVAVLGDLLRLAAQSDAHPPSMDRLGGAQLNAVVAAIRSSASHPRTFRLHGFEIAVDARWVVLTSTSDARDGPPERAGADAGG